MRTTNWEALDELRWLCECLAPSGVRLLARRPVPWPVARADWMPFVDVYETDAEVVIRADIPRLDPESLVIKVGDDHLVLRGYVPPEPGVEGRIYRRKERHSGPFQVLIGLPAPILPDRVSVTVESGIVEIRIAKAVPSITRPEEAVPAS